MDVYVALGSNQGDSMAILTEAMDKLQTLARFPIGRSSLWKTEPIDCPPGSPPFLNAVVRLTLDSSHAPESLLGVFQRWEREAGRKAKTQLNEARPLDLDLIAVDMLQVQSPQLVVPHPRAHQRYFVLAPLAELAPELVLPGQSKTVAVLLQEQEPLGTRLA